MSKNQQREAIIAELIALLKKERLQQKRSLNEIASRSGLSHTMVSRVEKRERTPTIDTLLRIGEALGVKMSKLLARAEKTAEVCSSKP